MPPAIDSVKEKTMTDTVKLPKHLLTPEFAALRKAILAAEPQTIAEYFDGMTEKERQKHAPFCYEWFKVIEKNYLGTAHNITIILDENDDISEVSEKKQQDRLILREIYCRSHAALVATASWSVIDKNDRSWLDDGIEAILRSRRPDWTLKFLEKRAADIDLHIWRPSPTWILYRKFVHDKIVEPSRADSITELMFAVIAGVRHKHIRKNPESSVLNGLQEDPALIDNELWNIFEITTFRRNWSFTTHDSFNHWKDAFCQLIRENTLPQERVLDGCLRSIHRPFTDHQVKWFVQLLERLIAELPLCDEVLADDTRFLGLLEHSQPTPRGLGLMILERLVKKGEINLKGIAGRLIPVLRESAKTKPKKALAILEKIAAKQSDLRKEIFPVLLEGLQHEEAEIQTASLDLLLKLDAMCTPKIRYAVQKMVPNLSASVRKRLAGCLPETPKPAAGIGLRPAKPPLETVREPITPIRNFDELLDLAARLTYSAENPDEIERLLDGLSRLGHKEPEDFERKTSSTLKQLLQLMGNQKDYETGELYLGIDLPFHGIFPIWDCVYLLLTWILKRVPHYTSSQEERKRMGKVNVFRVEIQKRVWTISEYPKSRSIACPPFQLFSEHVKAIANRLVRRESQQLLSTPTHYGGWIDPMVFVQRLIDAHHSQTVHGEHDRVLALLRLDLSKRSAALKKLERSIKAKDEYIDAVRYALGASDVRIGNTAHYWIAAARCRSPLVDDLKIERKFPGYGPDAGQAAVYSLKPGKHVGIAVVSSPPIENRNVDWSLFPTVGLHTPIQEDPLNFRQEHSWKLTIWPQNLDPAIGSAILPHTSMWDAAYDTGFQPFIDAMQCRGVPVHKIGAAAIAAALAIKCSTVHTAATDTLIITVEQERLSVETMTEAALEILPLNRLVVSRWLKPLRIIAEQSDRHAVFVYELLENIIEKIPTKDAGSFLDLLYELGISLDRTIASENCRKYLQTLTGSGKAAKIAKKLL
ncbi:MAG: DUF6493 family protein [Planctomycetaceae bacterium]|nr:DUF6493 family protein [Planctomycetaceae bacterium]